MAGNSGVVLRPSLARRGLAFLGSLFLLMTCVSLLLTSAMLSEAGSVALAGILDALAAGTGVAVLLTLWWQVWARVAISADVALTRSFGRSRRITRDCVVDIAVRWDLWAKNRQRRGGVGLSVVGEDRRGRLHTVDFDVRCCNFARALAILTDWVSDRPGVVRDPWAAKVLGVRVRPRVRAPVSGHVVAQPLPLGWGAPWLLYFATNPTESALDPDAHIFWRAVGGIAALLVISVACWLFAERKLVSANAVRHGFPRRSVLLDEFESVEVASSADDHPAALPPVVVHRRSNGKTAAIQLWDPGHGAAILLLVDGWVTARPELVQDEATEAWFVTRGVLPPPDRRTSSGTSDATVAGGATSSDVRADGDLAPG